MKKEVDYGNWVSKNILEYLGIAIIITAAVFTGSFLDVFYYMNISLVFSLRILFVFLFIVLICCTVYLYICRRLFSYTGKYKIQNKILDYVLSYLKFDDGKILDIGCGNGALSIKAAKKFKNSKITSIDYWGASWEFAKEQCIENADAEGVLDQIHFMKGDAAELNFEDESFDAVMSNFVFHEVRSVKDKRLVVKEALRVLKKGGVFCFHDLFLEEKLYGDILEFISQLKLEGIQDIHIVYTNKEEFIPKILKVPSMLGRIALIYGTK